MGDMVLGEIDLPSLRKLEIITGGLPKANLASVSKARWPRLETLILYFGIADYGGDCMTGDLTALLDATLLPRVKHLGLCNAAFEDDIARAVARSKILAQLQTLDLSKGTMSDEAILDDAKRFMHLESLDLSDNYISQELKGRLIGVFGAKLVVSSQGAPSESTRYVQISE